MKPTVLNVPGQFFEPSPKYQSSVAMILDSSDPHQSTGDSESPTGHVMVFWEIDVAEALSIINEYIEAQIPDTPTWWEARQMIDVLTEGRNWFLHTNSQGFVNAECEPNKVEAEKLYASIESEYGEWVGDE